MSANTVAGIVGLLVWIVVIAELIFRRRWPPSLGWAVIAAGVGLIGVAVESWVGTLVGFGCFAAIAFRSWRDWHLPGSS
jgi:hypothetical protein